MVKEVRKVLDVSPPKQPVNILLIGSDSPPGQVGRSDTLLLVRLDPGTKRISMLSVPRDLRVEIPGYGLNKINAAYSYGGAALAVKTVKEVTGLPINHYMQTYFGGFWHIVNDLGGVYMMIDHFYYNPVGSGYKSIDIQPGYQLLDGKYALNFVRYRHDIYADFGRMVRQQMFLKELQRQSMRWHNVLKLPRLIKAIVDLTSSDISDMKQFLSMVSLVLELNTAHIYNTHITGSTPTIGGVSYVVATPEEIQQAVQEFENPVQPPAAARSAKLPRKLYQVRVMSSSSAPTSADQAAGQLASIGFNAAASGTVAGPAQATTVIWSTSDFSAAPISSPRSSSRPKSKSCRVARVSKTASPSSWARHTPVRSRVRSALRRRQNRSSTTRRRTCPTGERRRPSSTSRCRCRRPGPTASPSSSSARTASRPGLATPRL